MGCEKSDRHFFAYAIVSYSDSVKNPVAERWISPLDDNGEPVDPLNLPAFLEPRNWDPPSCFCAMRGTPCKARFLVPTWQTSPARNNMCLACSSSLCAYFGECTCLAYVHRLF